MSQESVVLSQGLGTDTNGRKTGYVTRRHYRPCSTMLGSNQIDR